MSSFSPETNNTPTQNDTTPSSQNTPKQAGKNPIAEIIQFAIMALIIVIPIRLFIAQPFIVSGASMENTFHTNEYLIVDELSYRFHSPQRGDIIIFRYPRDPSKFFIKRVIALPGDTIDITGNIVTITNERHPDGMVLDEPYIKSMKENTYLHETLGVNEYFVMGDNRDESSDSRVWGLLTKDKIVGRAFLRLFPMSKVGIFPGEDHVTGTEVTSTNQ